MEDIKDLQTGAVTLGDLLARHLEDLKTQQGHLQRSMEICRAMQGADYATLDAALYLSQLEREAAAALAQDKIDRVDIPWRRFFARHLDWTLCTDVVVAIPLFFGLDLRTQGIGGLVVILAAGLGLVYLLEPRLLTRWGTTPGKLLWGIRATDLGGPAAGAGQAALSRTQGVIVQGMGLQIPIYNLWRWCRCYIENQEGKEMTWEEDSMLTLKDREGLAAYPLPGRPWGAVCGHGGGGLRRGAPLAAGGDHGGGFLRQLQPGHQGPPDEKRLGAHWGGNLEAGAGERPHKFGWRQPPGGDLRRGGREDDQPVLPYEK